MSGIQRADPSSAARIKVLIWDGAAADIKTTPPTGVCYRRGESIKVSEIQNIQRIVHARGRWWCHFMRMSGATYEIQWKKNSFHVIIIEFLSIITNEHVSFSCNPQTCENEEISIVISLRGCFDIKFNWDSDISICFDCLFTKNIRKI